MWKLHIFLCYSISSCEVFIYFTFYPQFLIIILEVNLKVIFRINFKEMNINIFISERTFFSFYYELDYFLPLLSFQKLLCYYCKSNFFFRAVKSFQEVLWVEPGFARACEVHIRLGLMLKVHGDFEAAHKHLTLALIDATTPASFSKLESKQVHYF